MRLWRRWSETRTAFRSDNWKCRSYGRKNERAKLLKQAANMKRIIPLIFLLQGLCPVLFFGWQTPSHHIYIATAIIYALITLGLWMAKRWAFVIAILVTLLQIVTVSFPLFAWGLFIGPSSGLFFTLPSPQNEYGLFWHLGVYFNMAIDEPSTSLQKTYSMHSNTFVVFNVFSAILFVLLLIVFRRINSQPPKS